MATGIRVTRTEEIMLQCLCDNCDASERLDYVWQVNMTGSPRVITDDANDKEVMSLVLMQKLNVTGYNTSNLVIPPTAWNDLPSPSLLYRATSFNVECFVNRPTKGNTNGTTRAALTPNAPPTNGTCVAVPMDGTAMQSKFRFTCFNWVDPDDSMATASYKFVRELQDAIE